MSDAAPEVTIAYDLPMSPTPTATPTAAPTAPTATTTSTAGVTAEIAGCAAQGDDYACSLRVTLGAALPVNTVFSVDIGGGAFANPSGSARPQVSGPQGCAMPPLPSPYLAAVPGRYTRYDVNISTRGCTAGAVMTFGELVGGPAGATITQSVTVPGSAAATATFVLPGATATPTATEPATPTATATARPTDTPEPTDTPTTADPATDQHPDTAPSDAVSGQPVQSDSGG